MIALGACLLLALLFAAALARLALGPSQHDRALAAHGAVLTAALLIASLAARVGQPGWIDIALALCFLDLVLAAAAFRLARPRNAPQPKATP